MNERDWRFAVVEQPELAPVFADWLEERGEPRNKYESLTYQHVAETVCGIPVALRCDMQVFMKWAENYYTQHPIKRVEIVGLGPLNSNDLPGMVFFSSLASNYSWEIPQAILPHMKGYKKREGLYYYPDSATATQAVNLACQAYGESLR